MSNIALSDYFCGDEEIRFTHFRIPRQLIPHSLFKTLSTDAKLLYSILLNRMGLSAQVEGPGVETVSTEVTGLWTVETGYAAGDCRAKGSCQLTTAVADGAVAALAACRYCDGER